MAAPSPSELLSDVFGFDAFRPGQAEIVAAVTAGDNTLAIMPTGGGKSLCFQLPALCRDGLTVVISPLIALMRDQVRALREAGVAAGALTSGNTRESEDAIASLCVSPPASPVATSRSGSTWAVSATGSARKSVVPTSTMSRDCTSVS